MRVARERLPQDRAEWHGFLRDYFCDKDAIASEFNGDIHLSLQWPSDPDRHVDPRLGAGLKWWGEGVTLGSMWSARRRDDRVLTSLYDTWTLLSWSEWLTRVTPETASAGVILHVGDHRDMGSPRLLVRGSSLVDAITEDEVSVMDPISVQRAIESGAIGMGSFMTPFLREFPNALVRHLCQPPKMQVDVEKRLGVSRTRDTLLNPDADRISVELAANAVGGGVYVGTSDVGVWSQDIQGRPALVHIDMDYFNNRYDGDSAWQLRTSRLDPDLPTMLSKVDEIIDALAASRAVIEDVAIAYSPGFFPAEYWQPVDRHLRAGLARIL